MRVFSLIAYTPPIHLTDGIMLRALIYAPSADNCGEKMNIAEWAPPFIAPKSEILLRESKQVKKALLKNARMGRNKLKRR